MQELTNSALVLVEQENVLSEDSLTRMERYTVKSCFSLSLKRAQMYQGSK